MNVKDIQEALKAAGEDPGPIDGVRGRKTIAAIKRFQEACGLDVDGIVGPQTAKKLFPAGAPRDLQPTIPSTIPWLQEAFGLRGTSEHVGPGSNREIIDWANDLKLKGYNDDDIPWCGLFVGHCVGSQLPEEVLPVNPLGARNWAKFGRETKPTFGAVMVFWRKSKASFEGHVGFYWAEDGDAFHVLGGNQSNAVTITRVGRDRLLNARWPLTAPDPDPTAGPRRATAAGQLSKNEA